MTEGTRRWLPTLPLRAWLVVSHVAVLSLPVAVVVGTGALGLDLLDQTRRELRQQASLLTLLAEADLDARGATSLDDAGATLGPRLEQAKAATLASVRVVDDVGVVVATSGEELGEDLSGRPEVRAALAGQLVERAVPRPSRVGDEDLSYRSESRFAGYRLVVVAPITAGGRTVGAVVLARTPREEIQALVQIVPPWAAAGTMAGTVLLAWALGTLATRSLRGLAGAAERIATGRATVGGLAEAGASHVAEAAALADAVEHMAERLAARTAYVGELAAGVSHEFKIPIATLRGTLELLADDPDMPPDQRQRFLDNAGATLDRLDRLVSGLLQLARAEQAASTEDVDLDTLVAALVHRTDGATAHGTAGSVRGDRAWLEVALGNLVENAREHGGGAVAVHTWRDGAHVGFDVVDHGPGISAANLPRVFERFFTTRRGHGTGLGLALVHTIVTAHGGTVQVTSQPGDTRFRVSLPAA